MQKPKCKLCGERHWGICPTPVEAFWRENHPLAKPSEGDFVPPPKPFDRAAYQRDYMRKRRAAAKAKRP